MTQSEPHRDLHARLLLRAGRGDAGAFEQLHAALAPAVRDYLASLDGSMDYHQRQDLVQEVFFWAWKNLGRFRADASAKTFVLAIARNVFRKELARRQRLQIAYVGDLDRLAGTYVPDELTPPDQGNRNDLPHAVRQAMARLPKAQRQAVQLDRMQDLPRAEALKRANCTPGQFAKRLHRAMTSLRRLLSSLPKCILM